jgi:hypothetical protein
MAGARAGEGVVESLLPVHDQILDVSLISRWSLKFDESRNSSIELSFRTFYHNKYANHGT